MLKDREKIQISREISYKFLSGNLQYWSNLRAPKNAHLSCFDQFAFNVLSSCAINCVRFLLLQNGLTDRTAPCYQRLPCKHFHR
jgi:hypothetical protein